MQISYISLRLIALILVLATATNAQMSVGYGAVTRTFLTNHVLQIVDLRNKPTQVQTGPWDTHHPYSSVIRSYTAGDFGGNEVFAVDFDPTSGALFTGVSTRGELFRLPTVSNVSARIYRIDPATLNASLFVNLGGSGQGVGGLSVDHTHNQLFAITPSTGELHRISIATATVLETVNVGANAWAVGYSAAENRVYYSVGNAIRYFSLTGTGSITGSPVGDFTSTGVGSIISDIEISFNGTRMLLAHNEENSAHYQSFKQYVKFGTTWVDGPAMNVSCNAAGAVNFTNSRGGAAFIASSYAGGTVTGQDNYVAITGDALHINLGGGTPCDTEEIYGLQISPVTGMNASNSIYIDHNSNITAQDKGNMKDVAVWNTVPVCNTSVSLASNTPVNAGQPLDITTTPSNASMPITYMWVGPNGYSSSTQNINIANATTVHSGSYTLHMTDFNGCYASATTNVFVVPPVCNLTVTPASNSPVRTGQVINLTSNATGANGAVTYSWSGPNNFTSSLANPTRTASMVNAGVYSLTVTDITGCSATGFTTIVVCNMSIVVSSNSPVTVGSSINISSTVTGGLAPINYNWSGPNNYTSTAAAPTIANASSLNAGSYFVTATAANGCAASSSVLVTVSGGCNLGVTATSNSPVVSGSTLNLNSTTSGGTAPLTYRWTGPSGFVASTQNTTRPSISPSQAGNYMISVTDANGCAATATLVVGVTCGLSVTASSNTPVATNGTISLTSNVTGGTAPFTYSWGGPASFSSSLQNPTRTNATVAHSGAYVVLVTDANGCTANATTNVVVNPACAITVTASSNTPVATNGTISLTSNVTGGTAPFTYSWGGPTSFTSTLQNPTRTNATVTHSGAYAVTVTDANGCVANATTNVVVNPACAITVTASSNTPVATGGTISLISNVTGGTAPFTYSWGGPTSFTSTLQNPTRTNATVTHSGAYAVTVIDANGCVANATTNVAVNPPTCAITVTSTSNTPVATGGTISLASNVTGGTAPFTYSWGGPASFTSTLQNPTRTNATVTHSGAYAVTVTDANGCVANATTNVVVNPPVCNASVSLSSNSPLAVGATLNLISTPSNVTAPVTYSWIGPNNFTSSLQSPSITNVVLANAGDYSLTITDANNCIANATITVVVGNSVEDCSNNMDDDLDGLVDCQDPDCQFLGGTLNCSCPSSELMWFITQVTGDLYHVNLFTGVERLVGNRQVGANRWFDLAWTPNGQLYAIANDLSLYSLSHNPGNVPATLVFSLTGELSEANALVAEPGGTLLIGGKDPSNPTNNKLVRYNPSTGVVTTVATLPISTFGDSSGDLAFICDQLYWTTALGLVNVNLANPSASTLASSSCVANSYGLASNKDGTLYTLKGTGTFPFSAPLVISRIASPNTTATCTPVHTITTVLTPPSANGISGVSMYYDWLGCSSNSQITVSPAHPNLCNGPVTLSASAVSLNNPSFTWTTPNGQSSGSTIVAAIQGTYSVTATDSNCAMVTTFVTVISCGLPPVAILDINQTLVNTPVNGNVLRNDNEPQLEPLTITLLTPPSRGAITPIGGGTPNTLSPDGGYTYSPNPGYSGLDSFQYVICDPGPFCDTTWAYIVITNQIPGNQPPFALPDYNRTFVDTPVSSTVVNNDNDPDGDPLLVNDANAGTPQLDPLVAPSNGTLQSFNPDGSFVYLPNVGFAGVDSFYYRICDAGGLCDETWVYIVITPDPTGNLNDEPFAHDDANMGPVNTNQIGSVAPNDMDPNSGQFLTWTLLPSNGGIANGTVVLNANGDYTYTPNNDYVGPDQFVYSVCDNFGLCDTATCYLLVTPAPPVGIIDINNTLVNTPVSGNVLVNDNDAQNTVLTVVDVDPVGPGVNPLTNPRNGTLTLNANGSYVYTPRNGFDGIDSFRYVLTNTFGLRDTVWAYIHIIPINPNNQPPFAHNDYNRTRVNTPVVGFVTGNDNDPEGDALTVADANPLTPQIDPLVGTVNGVVNLNANGSYTYTPNNNFEGVDSFQYRICDVSGLCDEAWVYISINGDRPNLANHPPFAHDDANSGQVNNTQTGNVGGNDNDPEGDPLTWSLATGPSNGTLVLNPNGGYTYTPNNNFVGADQFTYTVCDGLNSCDIATCYLLVTPNPPMGIIDINNTLVNTPVSGNILVNDNDPQGTVLTVVDANTGSITIDPLVGPRNGSVVLSQNGDYTYTPNANYVGIDSFRYILTNPYGMRDTVWAYINIVVNTAGNQAPFAHNDYNRTRVNIQVNGTVTANDNDPDGDVLTVSDANTSTPQIDPVVAPINGTLVLGANGSYTYTPNGGFVGLDSFMYRVCDPSGLCDNAWVYILVEGDPDPAQNLPPVAHDDANSGPINTPQTGTIAGNDSHPRGRALTWALVSGGNVRNGRLTLNSNGTYVYTPNPGFAGPDQFTYIVCDSSNLCDIAICYILVTPIPPLANIDFNNTLPGTPVTGNVLTNDDDPQRRGLRTIVTLRTPPRGGNVVLTPNGGYTYTPNAGTLVDSFEYVVCNEFDLCDTSWVYINITQNIPNVQQPPIASPDNVQTPVGTPVNINVVNNDIDPEGGPFTVNPTPIRGPRRGAVVWNAGLGRFVYTPNPGFVGMDTFYYAVCDPTNLCDTSFVVINVYGIPQIPGAGNNRAPFPQDDANTTNQGIPVSGNVSSNDTDPDGHGMTFGIVNNVPTNHGTVTINPNGTYTYTPSPNFSGPTSFTYQVCDTIMPPLCDTATVYLIVYPSVQLPPVAVNDTITTVQGRGVNISVLGNDSPNGTLTSGPTVVTPPARGTATWNATGNYFVYSPNANVCGPDSFRYVICNAAGCDTAWVHVNVACAPVIYNAVSPGGSFNPYFHIENIQLFPNSHVCVYNRWGNLVFETKGYNNDEELKRFNGTWDGNPLPDGTYFYVVNFGDEVYKTQSGYLEIRR